MSVRGGAREFGPYDLANPYPFYAWAREQAPVFVSEETGYYVVSRHADVKAVFEDWRTFSSENAQAPMRPLCDEGRRIMRDGGVIAYSGFGPGAAGTHPATRDRAGLFRSAPLQGDQPQIREVVNAQIDSFIDRGRADLSGISPTTFRRSCCSGWSACRRQMSPR